MRLSALDREAWAPTVQCDGFDEDGKTDRLGVPTAYNLAMQNFNFSLQGDYVELNQLLKLVGICDSGGAGKLIVSRGHVKVDGKTELRKTCKIRAGQVVRLGEVMIQVEAASDA
jgi:ribosome-associated protein